MAALPSIQIMAGMVCTSSPRGILVIGFIRCTLIFKNLLHTQRKRRSIGRHNVNGLTRSGKQNNQPEQISRSISRVLADFGRWS